MNHLLGLNELRNQYFAMRHGESKSNAVGLIISHPVHGKSKAYSLTEHGKLQVLESVQRLDFQSLPILYSSDFSRARDTAKIVQQELHALPVHLSLKLRERNFGLLEKSSIKNYARVWQQDARGHNQPIDEIESVESVLSRVTSLVARLEARHSNAIILLISHGDPLQILECGFRKIDPKKHRSVAHLEPAEIRELRLVM